MYSGMGQKVGFLVHNLATLVAGLAVGFLRSWKLTLVIMSFLPLLGVAGTIIKVTVSRCHYREGHGDSLSLSLLVSVLVLSLLLGLPAFAKKGCWHYLHWARLTLPSAWQGSRLLALGARRCAHHVSFAHSAVVPERTLHVLLFFCGTCVCRASPASPS